MFLFSTFCLFCVLYNSFFISFSVSLNHWNNDSLIKLIFLIFAKTVSKIAFCCYQFQFVFWVLDFFVLSFNLIIRMSFDFFRFIFLFFHLVLSSNSSQDWSPIGFLVFTFYGLTQSVILSSTVHHCPSNECYFEHKLSQV